MSSQNKPAIGPVLTPATGSLRLIGLATYHYLNRQQLKLNKILQTTKVEIPKKEKKSEQRPKDRFIFAQALDELESENRYQKLVDEMPTWAEQDETEITFGDFDAPIKSKVRVERTRKPKLEVVEEEEVEEEQLAVDDSTDTEMSTDFITKKLITRKDVRNCRGKKFYVLYKKLYFYLKSKYFLRKRDMGIINSMVQDARVWFAKEKMELDSSFNYDIMAYAVMVAFLPDEREMEFRQMVKNPNAWDNITHLNKTLDGNLGKSLRATLGLYKENTCIGGCLSSVKFPSSLVKP